jgi:hypothetical protein
MPIIEFHSTSDRYKRVFDPPLPAKDALPEWYKNQSRWAHGVKGDLTEEGLAHHTVKACMPIFDMITAGYILPCQCDVTFFCENNETSYASWSTNEMEAIHSHNQYQYDRFPIDTNIWQPHAFKFMHNWLVKTEPGYSTMFVHPFWHGDTPFYTLPGVVDTDKHPISVQIPFLLKKGYSGVIKTGTPIVQIIPFKREEWTSSTVYNEEQAEEFNIQWARASRAPKDKYKTNFREEKHWG